MLKLTDRVIQADISYFNPFLATVDNRNRIPKHARGCMVKLAQCKNEGFAILITILMFFLPT